MFHFPRNYLEFEKNIEFQNFVNIFDLEKVFRDNIHFLLKLIERLFCRQAFFCFGRNDGRNNPFWETT